MIDKQVKTTAEAVAGVRDGSTVLVAGFGAVGVADNLLDALHEQGARELTIVANNSGNGDYGLARLINSGRVRKVICSFPRSGDYSAFLNAYRAKSLELELLPQGTISERMRCHAAGLGGFFSPVSAGTKLGEGKETREIDGRLHVFEKPLKGDVALIKANKADRWGNLSLHKVGAEFQSGHGDGRRSDRGRGRPDGRTRRDGSRSRRHPEYFRRPRGRCRSNA